MKLAAPTIVSARAAEDRLPALVSSARAPEQLAHDREAVVQAGERADPDQLADGRAAQVHSVSDLDHLDLDSWSKLKDTPRQRLPVFGEALPVVDAPVFPPGPRKEASMQGVPGLLLIFPKLLILTLSP